MIALSDPRDLHTESKLFKSISFVHEMYVEVDMEPMYDILFLKFNHKKPTKFEPKLNEDG